VNCRWHNLYVVCVSRRPPLVSSIFVAVLSTQHSCPTPLRLVSRPTQVAHRKSAFRKNRNRKRHRYSPGVLTHQLTCGDPDRRSFGLT
jgi:hypothetical protein